MLLLSVILLQIPTTAGYKHTCDLWSWRSRDLPSFWRMFCVLSEQMLIFLRITNYVVMNVVCQLAFPLVALTLSWWVG